MRLNQYLAHAGVSSRRGSDLLIAKGSVLVNGQKATLGTAVLDTDTVMVNGRTIALPAKPLTYLLYKPKGVVSTTSDPEGRPTVLDYVPKGVRLYPVGRLDYNSEGLIILTSDGELANRLTHPRYQIEKVYRVLIRGHLSKEDQGRIKKGVKLSDGMTSPVKLANLQEEGGNMWLDITVTEGRNHLLKRLFEHFHHTVLRLIRLKIGEYELGELQVGRYLAI